MRRRPFKAVLVGASARRGRKAISLDVDRVAAGQAPDYLRTHQAPSLWVFSGRPAIDPFLRHLPGTQRGLGGAIVQDEPRPESHNALASVFHPLLFAGPNASVLGDDELAEALSSPHRGDLAIAGSVDPTSRLLTVMRGDATTLTVPCSAFENTSEGAKPDFTDFEIIDGGQTLRFGAYEAAFDSLLYEFDEAYRRRLNRKRQREALGLGPSLRRLRQQKRLRRTDFAPAVSAKTIARIESGQTTSTEKTRARIAKILGVPPEDLATY